MHDIESAKKYGELIREAREKHQWDLEIIMRTYLEKPRTTTGWEGFIADPHLDGSYDTNHGLYQARKLILHLASRWVPSATEFVSLTTPQFIADGIVYGAIGARTVESQEHRKLTSGLSMPTGMKNATSWSVRIAVDGIISANHSHWFPSITKHGTHALFRTKGNKDAHLILRGGDSGPNYGSKEVQKAIDLLCEKGLGTGVVIDESHWNSWKNYKMQPIVNMGISSQIRSGKSHVKWVMIESHIKEWAQKMTWTIDPEISITDSCVSWETTESMLQELAEAVKTRRNKK
jgi:3-deoxy-7-phosphoheptulonate synthase